MTNREKYRNFCETEQEIPLFSKDWWLDSVCGYDNWDVIIYEKGGHIYGTLPYFMTKKVIFNICNMPNLTQNIGIYMKYPKNQKYMKRLSFEKEVINYIMNKLPLIDSFSQNFHNSFTNWLPLYWLGYQQTTKYTYVIEHSNMENLEKILATDIKRRVKKSNNAGVEIYTSEDIKQFFEINKQTFLRQNIDIPYSYDFIKKLYDNCKMHNSVKIYFAEYEKKIIAVNFLVYDNNTVYYLMGGIDPEYRDIGAMDAILVESIKFSLNEDKDFDFEGSMVESIEKYFKNFGAIQKQYFNISKVNSKLLKIRQFIKDIVILPKINTQ
jgi:lipid II:glycine glycyltransferase (peptidoglycan interpeptide bridge formation enzyme)